MKFTIEKRDGTTKIFDNNGNRVFWEDSDGYWIKSRFDSKGNEIYWEDSDGYWRKSKFDSRGNKIYWEDSDGKKWRKDKPNETISAKDLDDCLKKLKKVKQWNKK